MKLSSKRCHGKHWLLAAGLALALGRCSSQAQDTNDLPPTNEVIQAEQMPPDQPPLKEMESAAEVSESTNGPPAPTQTLTGTPGPDAHSLWRERQQQNRRRAYNLPPAAEASAATNSPSSLDFSAFRLITERNIFDPNRMARSGPPVQAKTVDAFSLVGTMSYSKGDFAFFDGTSADYKKVLKPSETIAGYTVLAILPDSVKLTQDNKQINLPVGAQLRRQDDGTWVEVAGAETYAAGSNSSSSNSQPSSASNGGESEILKRLMLRREKD